MPRFARFVLGVALLGTATLPLRADPPEAPAPAAPSPYGSTYTVEELAALDRALHAGNMNREDLTFRKDMAKGTFCLPIVKAMLHDPLLIAPKIDEIVAALQPAAYATPQNTESLREATAEAFLAVITAVSLFWQDSSEITLTEVNRVTIMAMLYMPDPSRRPPATPEDALTQLEDWAALPASPFADERSEQVPEGVRERVLRRKLPDEMLMREVFPSPFDAACETEIEAYLKDGAPDAVARLAAELHPPQADLMPLSITPWAQAGAAVLQAAKWAPSAFPTDQPLVRETPHGRVALGTLKDDVYVGDFSVIVDPGGNDRYEKGRFGAAFGTPDRRVGLLLDLGGNDVYACGDVDCTLGAAILGVAALFDLGQGNDGYEGGHLSLGAAVGGIGVLYDDGGSDVYQGKTFTQGAAGYGIGILYDDSRQPAPALKTDEETKDPIAIAGWDNDRLSAWCTAQGFSRTLGVGLCVNARGNEIYEAGGVYLHAPLFSDRYQSFSQGFSIGAREHDIAGGVAALIDLAGNDRYLGDIYNQGVGYWYAAGLLYDGGGHDLYEMTQYGQGSGIHLAVGGLVDAGGSDAYVMHSGLGQGGSHDYAASVLHDRGGNDRYDGNTSCNGCGLTNSVGLFLERSGDDTYASKRDGSFNAGRPARGFGSVGVFLDLAGKDDYLGPPSASGPQDDTLWRGSDVGLGLDTAPAPVEADPTAPGGGTPAADQPSGKVEIPAICRYEGPLTQGVFDELWAIAVRWEVGDNRTIVPEARKRLIAFGKEVLPMLDAKMEKDESGLEIRAYADILAGLKAAGAGPEVVDLLRRNLLAKAEAVKVRFEGGPETWKDRQKVVEERVRQKALREAIAARRRKVALQLVGEMKEQSLAPEVVALLGGIWVLESDDHAQERRAASVLGAMKSDAGRDVLMHWLDSDEARTLVALGTFLGPEEDRFRHVRPLLDHAMVTVRTRLATLLAEKSALYAPRVFEALRQDPGKAPAADQPPPLSPRAARTLLDVVVRGRLAPGPEDDLAMWAGHSDWGVRADVARVLSLWSSMEAEGKLTAPLPAEVLPALTVLRQDPDPLVRRVAAPESKAPAPVSVPAK